MGKIKSRLSEIMGARRMDITDLAREANIAYGTAHKLYHHKHKQLDLEVLAKICEALEVQPGDLFIYTGD